MADWNWVWDFYNLSILYETTCSILSCVVESNVYEIRRNVEWRKEIIYLNTWHFYTISLTFEEKNSYIDRNLSPGL